MKVTLEFTEEDESQLDRVEFSVAIKKPEDVATAMLMIQRQCNWVFGRVIEAVIGEAVEWGHSDDVMAALKDGGWLEEPKQQ